ncbi:hypothetical protein Ancab_012242 [Ancistrocladus abbreviatus]
MESSRRAVESYWRSRMIDAATSDEDKVTPVYKLEEICELLRSSHASIVKEVSEFILKRLDHKSPIVKQKALRLIKYAVGKSGAEFRREMQRHSVAVRQLLHYKGQLDPLKGDALNKAVRDTAQEALSVIFSTDDTKPAPVEDLNKRMQGFGNNNFDMPLEEKKSFLSEVVGLGSASIKQGLSTLAQGHSLKKNDTGSYKSPTLRRSLTTEIDNPDRYERMEYHAGGQGSSGISKNATSESWGQDSRTTTVESTNFDPSSGFSESKTREERLLETIVTSGGVRLQPTRDALQAFLVEASKVDALALSQALELKLQSPVWQVRMKAVCVLEAILRRNDEHFTVVASYFTENRDIVVNCSESPQASLREKANKVLNLLGGEKTEGVVSYSDKSAKTESSPVIQMPDLIDTGDPDDLFGAEDSRKVQTDLSVGNQSMSASPLIDDLFGDAQSMGVSTGEQKIDDDPFADVSFHTSNNREQVTESNDLFAGMTVGDNPSDTAINVARNNASDPFDIFGSHSELPWKQADHKNDVSNLMAGLSISGNISKVEQKGAIPEAFPETMFSKSSNSLNGGVDSQATAMNANTMFPMGTIPYALPPSIILNQPYPSQAINYGAMGGFLAQQQFLAAMANFQSLGSLNSPNSGVNYAAGTNGGYSSPLPDVFHANMPTQVSTVMQNNSKKEETKAFDFISDHLAAARDPKRVV